MSSSLGSRCIVCDKFPREVNHIAINDDGNIIVLCDPCYAKVELFFRKERKSNAKTDFGRSDEEHKHSV